MRKDSASNRSPQELLATSCAYRKAKPELEKQLEDFKKTIGAMALSPTAKAAMDQNLARYRQALDEAVSREAADRTEWTKRTKRPFPDALCATATNRPASFPLEGDGEVESWAKLQWLACLLLGQEHALSSLAKSMMKEGVPKNIAEHSNQQAQAAQNRRAAAEAWFRAGTRTAPDLTGCEKIHDAKR